MFVAGSDLGGQALGSRDFEGAERPVGRTEHPRIVGTNLVEYDIQHFHFVVGKAADVLFLPSFIDYRLRRQEVPAEVFRDFDIQAGQFAGHGEFDALVGIGIGQFGASRERCFQQFVSRHLDTDLGVPGC